ncbi:MAG: hypothetical protein M3279_02240 [Actinomycetota bacterium]|nr:hypothetical protein [Actinomycetota bacterium]
MGSELGPGESASVTLEPGSSHKGHSDYCIVSKDADGDVSSEKWHTDGVKHAGAKH